VLNNDSLNSGIIGVQRETQKCYNCEEVGHFSKVYPKSPKDRDVDVDKMEAVVEAVGVNKVEEEATEQI
jgi:Zinc knuckle